MLSAPLHIRSRAKKKERKTLLPSIICYCDFYDLIPAEMQ